MFPRPEAWNISPGCSVWCLMPKKIIRVLCLIQLCIPTSRLVAQLTTEDSLRHELTKHAEPLDGSGEALLLKEAQANQYFLLGELHGEVEIPGLLSDLWPSLWQDRYRHVAAEVSPWAATHLQQSVADDPTPVVGLWTRAQASVVEQFASPGQSVLWGCDIEEEQPDQL